MKESGSGALQADFIQFSLRPAILRP